MMLRGPIGAPRSSPATSYCLTIIAVLVLMMEMMTVAFGQSGTLRTTEADNLIRIDIPAQSLSNALYAFSGATGIEVLVDARLVAGAHSAGVKGIMVPHDALELILAGSNLVAKEFGPGTVTLKTVTFASPGRPASVPASGVSPYFVDIQRAILRVLCGDARTLPGHYRLALKLWVGKSGTVLRLKRLDTTGDQNLDATLDMTMQGMEIGRPPPADLPQPITLVISRRQMPEAADCPPGGLDLRHASIRKQ
jgi:hypothetical protein